MKNSFHCICILALIMTIYLPVCSQSDLEEKIKMIFLYQPHPEAGEKYDRRAEIEKLSPKEQVRGILLVMLVNHQYATPGTEEYLYLTGATSVLGRLRDARAEDQLSSMLFDQNVHENARALAAQSLGQIDPEKNKHLFLRALGNKDDYFAIRVYAAEALAKTKDPQVLESLEQYAREETDSHVRQKLEKSAQELRTNMRRRR
jgi:HEAT repeat protein